jgi:hypothetical protein
MTDPFDEHAERLRRALHAEADAVMPSTDALDHIRTRIAQGHRPERPPVWMTLPWLRPLAAATAAAAAAIIALAAPPMISIIANPAGSHQAGEGPGGVGRSNGYFTPPAQNPNIPTPVDSASAVPTNSVAPSATPSLTKACERPDSGHEATPDPSSSPTPTPRPTRTCPDEPGSPPAPNNPNPGATHSVEPTTPTGDTSQEPAPALPGERMPES